MKHQTTTFPVLGISRYKRKTYLFTRQKSSRKTFSLKKERLFGGFGTVFEDLSIQTPQGKETIALTRDFRFTDISIEDHKRYALTYISVESGIPELRIAVSSDRKHWKRIAALPHIHSPASLLFFPEDSYPYILYHGKAALSVSKSQDLRTFSTAAVGGNLLALQNRTAIRVGGIKKIPEGILVLYFAYTESASGRARNCAVYGALFDKEHPTEFLWQGKEPIWTVPSEDVLVADPVALLFKDSTHAVSYWRGTDNALYALKHWLGGTKKSIKKKERKITHDESKSRPIIKRHIANPVLSPRDENDWESTAAFNPTAVHLGGKTHLVYRAVGRGGESVFGYASSNDGFSFDERLSYPIFFDRKLTHAKQADRTYSPVLYPSGGSWGGYEDPRVVRIDDRVYMTFNLFEDWLLRVGFASISINDFLKKNFHKWDGPHILSHGVRDKNWVLFPEKMNGQFAVLHSIIGETQNRVRIEYIDDLKELSKRRFESPDPQRVPDKRVAWHIHVRSAGPPPVKTPHGWLLFYHANDEEFYKYKVGAMLLDLDDPTKILVRAKTPVLEPDFPYENGGKPGVVYAAGALIHDGEIRLYYGGGDTVSCVASAPIDEFLEDLLTNGEPELTPVYGC